MDYLTNYYKNLSESLQQRVNYLQTLLIEEEDRQPSIADDAFEGYDEEQDEEIGTITMREVLHNRYGKEKAEEMIKSIREREKQYPFDSEQTVGVRQEFEIPDYSDENLDKPIKIMVNKTLNNKKTGGFAKAVGPNARIVLNSETQDINPNASNEVRVKNPIEIPNDAFHVPDPKMDAQGNWVFPSPKTNTDDNLKLKNMSRGRSDLKFGGELWQTIYDLMGHEMTHMMQNRKFPKGFFSRTPDWVDPEARPDQERAFTPTNLIPKSERERKAYSQNRYEPAAEMAELKHAYFQATNNILRADMRDHELKLFLDWYDKNHKGKRKTLDDAVALIRTREGQELFRRVAKAKTPGQTQRGGEGPVMA